MSCATFDTPIQGPDIPPGNKARFAALLLMRDAANRAFDKATALPRLATGYVVSLFHRWAEAAGSTGALLRLGEQAHDAANLVRQVGLLAALVPVLWLRLALELVLIPLVLDPTLVRQVREQATSLNAGSEQEGTDGKAGNQGQVLIDPLGIAIPTFNGSTPSKSAEQSSGAVRPPTRRSSS